MTTVKFKVKYVPFSNEKNRNHSTIPIIETLLMYVCLYLDLNCEMIHVIQVPTNMQEFHEYSRAISVSVVPLFIVSISVKINSSIIWIEL